LTICRATAAAVVESVLGRVAGSDAWGWPAVWVWLISAHYTADALNLRWLGRSIELSAEQSALICSREALRRNQMPVPLTVQEIEKYTIVEFRTPSLMDPVQLEEISAAVFRLVDDQDRRRLILDFEQVEYLSSQALGILMSLHKKLGKLPHSQLVLCGVGATLMQLLKITALDKVLKIKPTQKEALKVVPA
jgi:anti-sigma B factor antagonist